MNKLVKQRKRPWVAYDRAGYPADEAHQFDPATFEWVPRIESQWELVRDELKSVLESDGEIYLVVRRVIVASLKGQPQPLVIEAARTAIGPDNQPSFSEIFDGLRAAR